MANFQKEVEERCLMDIDYRDARIEDCTQIAEYIDYASDGILECLFKGNAAGMGVAQVLTYGLENEYGYNTYKSVIVAEYQRSIIGIVQSYSSIHHRIDDEMKEFFSKEKLEQFKEFYDSRIENSLLVNAMFVEPTFRCIGIGTKLLSLSRIKAKSLGFDKLSLFVLADNINALRVYSSFGFNKEKEIKPVNHNTEILLMSCNV